MFLCIVLCTRTSIYPIGTTNIRTIILLIGSCGNDGNTNYRFVFPSFPHQTKLGCRQDTQFGAAAKLKFAGGFVGATPNALRVLDLSSPLSYLPLPGLRPWCEIMMYLEYLGIDDRSCELDSCKFIYNARVCHATATSLAIELCDMKDSCIAVLNLQVVETLNRKLRNIVE